MRTLKAYIGTIKYDKESGTKTIETISKEEFSDLSEYNRKKAKEYLQKIETRRTQKNSKKGNKKKKIKKGCMDGKWMKQIYGQ